MHWISREVKELQGKYQTSDPFELADYLGYMLIPYHFKRIRGMLLAINGITIIGYNCNLPRRAQGLVIYHEIAHRRLHPHVNHFSVLEHTYLPIGKYEYQAERFVAELLLSERKPQYGETIYEFAARYDIPVDLIKTLA